MIYIRRIAISQLNYNKFPLICRVKMYVFIKSTGNQIHFNDVCVIDCFINKIIKIFATSWFFLWWWLHCTFLSLNFIFIKQIAFVHTCIYVYISISTQYIWGLENIVFGFNWVEGNKPGLGPTVDCLKISVKYSASSVRMIYKLVSSAKRRILALMSVVISLIYTRKRRGPRIDPWRTPALIEDQNDEEPAY